MTQDVDEFSDMSDDEVLYWFEEACSDLAEVAAKEPNTEWHECCFAATIVLADEMSKRNLNRKAQVH